MKYTAFFIISLILSCSHTSVAQGKLHIDSVRKEIQGAWRMNADTNMYLVFTSDTVVHHMFRTSGTGRSKYEITQNSCEPNSTPAATLYILETYRYYQYKEPREGKLCSELVSMKNGVMVLKRDKIVETYSKLKSVPAKH